MDDTTARLIDCFRIVFPDLPDGQISAATQESVEAWDSVATVTLLNVIEEQFEIQVDFDRIEELGSFQSIHHYVLTEREAS